jgi:peptide/nickel transport system permease protein
MLFLLFFAYGDYLRLFPMNGLHSDAAEHFGFFRYAVDYLWHIILPVTCLSLFSLAGMAMYSRTSMLDVIGQDYIRTARAKGLSEDKVIMKHAFRNSLIPIITLFSNVLPAMLGGSVLIEYIFGIPGMGQLSWSSILSKDYPTLMALLYIDAIVVMLSILLSDILYVLVDPRISFEAQG